MTKDQQAFVHQLAVYLVGDAASKSVLLQAATGNARTLVEQWRDLRRTTPLFGYQTVEEAEQQLRRWLWPEGDEGG